MPGEWISFTPTLTATTTDPVLGTSPTRVGYYTQVGKNVLYRFLIVFGTGATVAAGNGTYRISTPIAASANLTSGLTPLYFQGRGRFGDSSANVSAHVDIQVVASQSYMQFAYTATHPTGTFTAVTNAAPWTWAASDFMTGQVIYEAA